MNILAVRHCVILLQLVYFAFSDKNISLTEVLDYVECEYLVIGAVGISQPFYIKSQL